MFYGNKIIFVVKGAESAGMLKAPISSKELLSVVIACSDYDSFLESHRLWAAFHCSS